MNIIRRIYDYPQQNPIFRLGYVRRLTAHASMKLHTHPGMMEFVYLERGNQDYQVGQTTYTVEQGEAFFTMPDELHDSASAPQERSSLYYLIVHPERIKELGLFQTPEEYHTLITLPKRIYRPANSLLRALKHLEKTLSSGGPFFDTRIRNALSEVLLDFIVSEEKHAASPKSRIQNSFAYIESHLDQPLKVAELASMDFLSIASYNRAFLQATGIPPGEYIQRQRIGKAKRLLAETNRSITEIAFDSGFSSGQYFATVFKRFCNCTPKEYRKSKANRKKLS